MCLLRFHSGACWPWRRLGSGWAESVALGGDSELPRPRSRGHDVSSERSRCFQSQLHTSGKSMSSTEQFLVSDTPIKSAPAASRSPPPAQSAGHQSLSSEYAHTSFLRGEFFGNSSQRLWRLLNMITRPSHQKPLLALHSPHLEWPLWESVVRRTFQETTALSMSSSRRPPSPPRVDVPEPPYRPTLTSRRAVRFQSATAATTVMMDGLRDVSSPYNRLRFQDASPSCSTSRSTSSS